MIPKPLARVASRIGSATRWSAVVLLYKASRWREGPVVEIALPGLPRFTMKVHVASHDFVSRTIVKERVWEPVETRVVLEILRHVDVFVDVGANIGWYTVVAGLALAGRGRVIAFEPDPDNFVLLGRNVAANRLTAIQLHHAALAEAPGERALFRSRYNLGDHRLNHGGSEGRAAVTVVVTTFDALASPAVSGPCLVKMDTQGSEAMILTGMRRHLAARPGEVALLIEFWPFGLRNAGSSAAALIAELEPLGLRAFVVDEQAAELAPTTLAELAARAAGDLRPETERSVNVLLVPPGHPAEAALSALQSPAAPGSMQSGHEHQGPSG